MAADLWVPLFRTVTVAVTVAVRETAFALSSKSEKRNSAPGVRPHAKGNSGVFSPLAYASPLKFVPCLSGIPNQGATPEPSAMCPTERGHAETSYVLR